MRASHSGEPQTVFPWNTRVLLCAGSKLYSHVDRGSLVFDDATLSFSCVVLYPGVHKLLCGNDMTISFLTIQGQKGRRAKGSPLQKDFEQVFRFGFGLGKLVILNFCGRTYRVL